MEQSALENAGLQVPNYLRNKAGLVSTRAQLRTIALVCAVLLGVLADVLIRGMPGRPGLNVALWAIAGVCALIILVRRRADAASRETQWVVGGALLLAVALILRDADALAVFSLLSAVLLLGLAAGRATKAWATRAHVSDVAFAAVRVGVLCATGPLGWAGAVAAAPASGSAAWRGPVRTGLRGTLMALPALLVLGGLLMSADPVFAGMIQNTFRIDINRAIEHIAFTALITWLTLGYLRAFLVRDDALTDRLRVPQPALAAAEVTVALWILNVLFIVFMVVQLRYLFGGANLVEVTAGLSYAEYARRGFFELVATAALVVPILLVADWAAAPNTLRARTVLRATMVVLVVLLVGVIASAAYRMHLYQQAYGLTEQRLYVTAFIIWLTVMLGWLMFTVLRDQRERFVFGGVVAGLLCLAGLYVVNPHALIARVNLDRAAAGVEYDGAYVSSLSADAVPVLLARLDQLPQAERCRVSGMLEKRWGVERPGGWRSWNMSDARARRLVSGFQPPASCPAAAVQPSSNLPGERPI